MKNVYQWLAIIALAAVIGFFTAGCDEGNSNNNNNGGNDSGGQTPGGTQPTTPEAMSTKTALQYFTDNNIRAGWNLGNTLDAVSVPAQATETAWGNPAATQALFNGVKQSGFDIVRIPSTWFGHIGAAPDYTIDEARLKRVAEVAGYAKTAGIKAVIINIHHDGNNTAGDNTTWGFVDMPAAVNDPAKKNEIQDQISKMWTQIAEYFKNYGDYLIFETLNEVHNGNWGSNAPHNEQDILFDWNQAALSAIRATGGNNATRFVAVPGLGGTEPDVVVAANNRNKLLPNDGNNGTNKLIVSVHYYAPAQYTVAGVTDQAFQLIHTWGTQTEIDSLNHEMGLLKTNFIDKGIAVYIGEWGAPTDVRSSMNQTIKDTHLNYIKSVATAARQNGVIPVYWDDGGNFKVLERSNGKPKTGLWKDVLDTMITAITNTTPLPPGSGSKVITINPNIYDDGSGTAAQHGYQAKIPLSELLGGSIQVASGNTFTLTYTFTSNVAIDNLLVVLVDTREAVSWWAELSGYADIGAVTVGTPVSGTKTITATVTAGDSSNDANQLVLNIGESDSTASAPTLTFTALTLVKNEL